MHLPSRSRFAPPRGPIVTEPSGFRLRRTVPEMVISRHPIGNCDPGLGGAGSSSGAPPAIRRSARYRWRRPGC
ncbi:hypothetical protein FRACA_250009 [Frankia canadensis]|uniref:Uncharacterized protein n=1 Tax=Frankia canadensis TaxID=1836972 RepID=A0A2I2KRZ0_9ACTN|nr:hypothetical protein FRACA_250009 [Frankia canadensis]SOU55724.1 hypothetical protein FRACA_250009 [Frankia canadensis]